MSKKPSASEPASSPAKYRALQTFWSDETRSEYVEGLGYGGGTVFDQLIDGWIGEGKFEAADDSIPAIAGEGG